MMLRAKVVVGLSYKLKSHIPKWGNEPNVVMERGGKVRGVRKELKFSLVCSRRLCSIAASYTYFSANVIMRLDEDMMMMKIEK